MSPLPHRPGILRTTDLSTLPPAARLAETEHLVAAEAATPFDLSAGPVFRARLLVLGAEEYELVVNAHHMVFDGWSGEVLMHELAVAYQARTAGVEPRLPPLTARYADFAAWQRDRLRGERMQRALRYWTAQLREPPPRLELTNRSRPRGYARAGANLRLPLPAGLDDRLARICREEQVTRFMVLLTVFTAMLHLHSGQRDLCVGSPAANRELPAFERLIGFFVNTLVLRTAVAADDTLRGLLRRVRGVCLDAYEHAEVPFDLLVEHLSPVRRTGENPLFSVNFAVDEAPGATLSLPGVTVRQGREVPTGAPKFDLSWLVERHPAGPVVCVDCDTGVFSADDVAAMVGTYQRVVEHMDRDLDALVADVGAEPEPTGAAAEAGPGHDVEDEVRRMWAEAFGAVPFTDDDDFFQLGGYSMLAAEMCVRLSERYGVEVSLRSFFETPTVSGVAGLVRAAPAAEPRPQAPDGPRLGDVLSEIEQLSDDEVAAALHSTRGDR
jgi:acyl carrier protein